MKIISWNVNGIRACVNKGFLDWFAQTDADFVAIQETKAHLEQLDLEVVSPKGYQSFWHSGIKKGYSSTAIYTKHEPINITHGLGDFFDDQEGRVQSLEMDDFILINAYFPNSQRDHARLGFKLEFCQAMFDYLESLRSKGKNIILCGDYNIAHKDIDLKNPKTNQNTAGFLPEERAWFTQYLSAGYVDAFRTFEKGPDHYTWWSYRPGVRQRNIGWRIDYFTCNPEFEDRLLSCTHYPDVLGSDHCPIELKLKS
ncbi:MAG: exodeoxyribonuclease III [Deltaproteobacteria bacterium]|nr:exodeoxyribonuclease III [Deltaproteobacteria bacterium]